MTTYNTHFAQSVPTQLAALMNPPKRGQYERPCGPGNSWFFPVYNTGP